MNRAKHSGAANLCARAYALALIFFLVVLLLAPRAWGNWTANGVQLRSPNGHQSRPAICSDGSGGIYAAFRSDNQLLAQHVGPTGDLLWNWDGIAVKNVAGNVGRPVVVPTGNGEVIIAWADYRTGDWDIYAQRLTWTGSVASGWDPGGVRLTFLTKDETNPVAVSDAQGGAIVTWELEYGIGDLDIYASRVTASGTVASGWPAFGLGVATRPYLQDSVSVAVDDAGGALIAWQEDNTALGTSWDIRVSRVTPIGTIAPGWSIYGNLVCSNASEQHLPSLVRDGFGGALVFWDDQRGGGAASARIYAQRVDASGVVQWPADGIPICSAAETQVAPLAVEDQAGGAIVVFNQYHSSLEWDVAGQRVNGNGFLLWNPAGILLCSGYGDMTLRAACADGAGGVIAVWSGNYGGATSDLYAQHLTADGRLAWPAGPGAAVCTAASDQGQPTIASDGAGGAIFAWGDSRTGVNRDVFAMQLTGLSDLQCTTPPGWSSPVVPRRDGGAANGNVILPSTLDGNTSNTYWNWSTLQAGPNRMPLWYNQIDLDGSYFQTAYTPDDNGPVYWIVINCGPFVTRGGRHTITLTADPSDQVPESDETNNTWNDQWVWSPLAMVKDSPALRDQPPARGLLTHPNCDGFQFTQPDTRYAWVVSMAPLGFGDDYDLIVYDDYIGSTAGFSNQRAYSNLGSYSTDFVVGHYTSSPTTVYPAVIRYAETGPGDSFAFDQTDASTHNFSGNAQYPHQNLGAYRLADVFEGNLIAGHKYYFMLVREAGTSELELAAYSPATGGMYGRLGALRTSGPKYALTDTLSLVASTSGWYPFVVYRTHGGGAATPVTYSLYIGAGTPVAVPDTVVSLAPLSFEGTFPNPLRERSRLVFSLSQPGPAQVEMFDTQGRRVRTLAAGTFDAGRHEVLWDGRTAARKNLAAGVYFMRFTAEGRTFTRRVVVLK